MSRPARRRVRRAASAVVELAVTLPILVSVVFGTFEVCQVMYVKQSLSLAAYESARLASRRGTTAAETTAYCRSLLSDRRVAGGAASVSPGSLDAVATGAEITVTASAPWRENSLSAVVLQSRTTLSARCTMVRE